MQKYRFSLKKEKNRIKNVYFFGSITNGVGK